MHSLIVAVTDMTGVLTWSPSDMVVVLLVAYGGPEAMVGSQRD